MQIFPITIIITLVFLLFIRRNLDNGIFLSIALLPFGMAALVNLPALGNLSLLAAQVVAGATIGLMIFKSFLKGTWTLTFSPDRDEYYVLFLCVYSLFSVIVLTRLFAGDIYVFPLNGSEDGFRVHSLFASKIELLEPGTSNVSQLFYLFFSAAFFFLCRMVVRLQGLEFLHSAIVVAAVVNIVIGIIDLAGLDSYLQLIRTAKYALLNTHEVQGLPRVIGGFSEASAYGGFSSVMTAYFAAHFLCIGGQRSCLLAILSASAAVLSFSTTAYLGLSVAGMGLLIGAIWMFSTFGAPIRQLFFIHAVVLIFLTLIFLIQYSYIPVILLDVLEQILFSKSESVSALERGAWASGAIMAFRDSNYLGVGVGSLRGNGLLSVYLGSVGIPGALLFLTIYRRSLTAIGIGRRSFSSTSQYAIVNAARLALITKLLVSGVTATTPDPGFLAMLFCAILTVSRPILVRTDTNSRKVAVYG